MSRVISKPAAYGWHISANNFLQWVYSHTHLNIRMPFFIGHYVVAGSILACLAAAVNYGLIRLGFLKRPAYLPPARAGVFTTLNNIWNARIARRMISVLVRSPFRKSVLRLVHPDLPVPSNSGCVIAICHTPWKRLLVQWCLEHNFALVVSNGTWTGTKRCIQRQGMGVNDLRGLVRHLRQNGRVIVSFDNFNGLVDCPVTFMGREANASLFATRLAKMANVPLIAAIPVLRGKKVEMEPGPSFDVNGPDSNPVSIMKYLLLYLESEIKENPAVWSPFVK